MFLTWAEFDEEPEALEEGVRHITEEVVPAIRGTEGLIAGYWAVDRENGKRMGVLIWKNADAPGVVMPGVSAKIKAQRDAAGRDTQPGPDRTGRYQVVAEVC
jgi:hypothetical protein